MLKWIFFQILPLLFMMTPQQSLFANEPNNISSSGCFIKIEERLLLVKDVWSGMWSLPGGGQNINEAAKKTALRETKKETNLSVQILEPLKQFGGFLLFQCIPIDVVRAMKTRDNNTFRLLPPKNAKNKIEDIALVSLSGLNQIKWKFPSQKNEILQLFKTLPSFGSLNPITEELTSAHYQKEIKWVRLIQSYRSKTADILMIVVNFLGEEKFYFFILPYFWLCCPWNIGFRLTFLLILSTLLNGLAKDFFSLPRPKDIDPSIDLLGSHGFGFPSGHTQIATTFLGFLLLNINMKFKYKLGCIMLILTGGIARMYWGAHFLSDLLGGWILGAAFLFIFQHFSQKKVSLNWITTYVLFLFFSALLLWIRPHPDTWSLLSLLLGVLLGVQLYLTKQALPLNVHPKKGILWLRWFLGVAGLVLLPEIIKFLAPNERTFSVSFGLKFFQYISIGLWISWGAFRVTNYATSYINNK